MVLLDFRLLMAAPTDISTTFAIVLGGVIVVMLLVIWLRNRGD